MGSHILVFVQDMVEVEERRKRVEWSQYGKNGKDGKDGNIEYRVMETMGINGRGQESESGRRLRDESRWMGVP